MSRKSRQAVGGQGSLFASSPPADGAGSNRLVRPLPACFAAVSPPWQALVQAFVNSEPGQALLAFVAERQAAGATIYPADPLRALGSCGPADVRVVILGQDPYHGPDEAEGLAFSVPVGVRIPPSLRNIRKELASDLGAQPASSDGSLAAWIRQGVLLLNTCLTVERDQAGSHARRGWEAFTDAVIAAVAADPTPKVFLLWGAHAQGKTELIRAEGGRRHQVLASNHPSPLSASRGPVPFLGSRPFSRSNAWLEMQDLPPVDWLAGR